MAAPGHRGEVTADLPAEIAVQVENLNSSSITIHLEAGGISRRLGQMNTQETKSFVIPWKQLAGGTDFRLRGEVIGSDQRVFTGIMRVQPGQVVRWTLTPNLNMSSVTVF